MVVIDKLQMSYRCCPLRLMLTMSTAGSTCWRLANKGKGSPSSITARRVPELIPVLGSQPASDVNHKPGGRLPLLPARPAVTPKGCYQFRCLVNRGTMGVNGLPKTVIRQRRGCDLNPGLSAFESSTLTSRLPSLANSVDHIEGAHPSPQHERHLDRFSRILTIVTNGQTHRPPITKHH